MNVMQFSPATEEVQRLQELTAWLVMTFILVGCIVAVYMLKYRSKTHEQRRQLQAIRPQILSGDGQTTYVHRDDSAAARREKLDRVLGGSKPQITGIRDGVRSIQSEVSRTFPSVPVPILRGVFEAVGLVVLAVIIALGTVQIDSWVVPSGGDASVIWTGLEWAFVIVMLVGILAYWIVSLFPGGEYLIALRDPAVAIPVSLGLAALLVGLSYVLREDPNKKWHWFRHLEPKYVLAAGLFKIGKLAALIVITVLSVAVVVDGHLLSMLLTIYAGGPLVWAATLASTVVLWAVFSVVAPNAAEDIGSGIQRTINSAVVRTRLIIIGAPIMLTGMVVLILFSFTASIRVTVIGALVAILLSRGILHIWAKVKYRTPAVAEPDIQVREIPVTGSTIEDADGTSIHILTVDGYPLAHRDRGELLDTAVDACSWRLDGAELQSDEVTALIERWEQRTPPRDLPAVEHYYYKQAVEQGKVDYDEVVTALRGDIETRVKATLKDRGGSVDRDRIVRELQHEYPADMVAESLEFLEKKIADVASNQGKLILR